MSKLPRMHELFSNRNFLRLWIGQAVSYTGDALAMVAIPVYVFQLTGSAAALGGSFAFLQLPWIILMPFAGVLGDRVNRKLLLVAGIMCEAVAISLLIFTGALWQVYVLVVAAAVAQVIQFPSLIATMIDVVGERLYSRAVTVRMTTMQATEAIGSAVAGALIALLGVKAVLGIDVGTFLVYAVLMAAIRLSWAPRQKAQDNMKLTAELWRGINFIRSSAPHVFILKVMVLRGLTMIGAWSIVYAFVKNDLHAGPFEYGLFASASALGYTVSAATYTYLERFLSPFRIFIWGNILAGILLLPFVTMRWIPFLVIVLFLSFYAYGTGNLVANVYMAQLAPSEIRARVVGMNWAIIRLAQATSSVAMGFLAVRAGAVTVLLVAGVGLAGGCSLLALQSRGQGTRAALDIKVRETVA